MPAKDDFPLDEKHSGWMDAMESIPGLFSAVSASILLLRALCRHRTTPERGPGYVTSPRFSFLQLVGCSILFSLSAATLKAGTTQDQLSLFACFTYCFVLALVIFFSRDKAVSLHLQLLLFSCFLSYVYRDLWPLATRTTRPRDLSEGRILWFKISVLVVVSVFIPLVEPRPRSQDVTPEEAASMFSRLTYTFLDPLILLAYHKTHIPSFELPRLAKSDSAAHLAQRSFDSRSQGLLRRLLNIFRTEIVALTVLYVLQIILSLATPLGLNQLLRSLEVVSPIRPWFWIVWIFFAAIFRTVISEWYMYIATRTMVQIEAILTQQIFQHSLRFRVNFEVPSGSRSNDTMGKLMNLVTSDLSNITAVVDVWLVLVLAPVQITLSSWFLYAILGWSALVGLAVMIACLPLPAYITVRVMQGIQVLRMKRTDERVQVVTEAMTILRMVKIFGWESRMRERMTEKRKLELEAVKQDKLLSLIVGNFNFFIPFLTMIAAYATYTLLMKQALTASTVFSSMAVFELLRLELRKVLLAVPIVVKGKVSLSRLESLLHDTEMLDSALTTTRLPDGKVAGFRMTNFSWDANSSNPNFTLKINSEIIFQPGINLIIGPTGTGKTSMLLALLGEMRFKALGPDSWSGLDRTKGVAYAPQEYWLQNKSVRENIVMDSRFDEERYNKVLDQCGLSTDLALFERGDRTMVGERGLTLSGGQKARITLARCIYSPAQIILLDDPLSALDSHTATHIVHKCLAGDMVLGRTVLLVTHNVSLASRIANFIVVLGSDGSIQHGPVDQVLVKAAATLTEDLQRTTRHSEATSDEPGPKYAITEEAAEGHVQWPAIKLYLANLSKYPILFWIAFVALIALNEITLVFQAWFLGYWSAQYERLPASEVSPSYYLSTYAAILASAMVFYSGYFTIFTFGSMRASLVIHGRLMNSIVGSTMRWLDMTPTSRVIARATQDMQSVDDAMAVGVIRVLQLTLSLCIKFATIIVFSPAFLVPGLLITLIGALFGQLFMRAQLPVKREMSSARSPILGHFSAVITGLACIRAFGVQDEFFQESLLRIDHYTRITITYHNLNRWIACRSDILGGTFMAILASYLIYIRKDNAVATGFVLNNAFGYSLMVLQWVKYFNTVELNGNSLERILQYISVEQEHDPMKNPRQPPAFWPASGHVVVNNLTASYSEDGPPVLHNISFEIHPGERIGIVGRTGSGKSSLILSLLRCIITKGTVIYDGIQTDSLNLDILRSNITIVPQVPELLSGTLRYNLDPFGEYKDSVLYAALRSSGLYNLQNEGEEGGQLTLDSVVSGGGANLSAGQRQVLALARAIVRESKLLILDEATSAVDYATDAVIQSTLRDELKSDVTILTIAHRLQTIMDFDRVMVLDAGSLVEFDTPRALLKKDKGYLKVLVEGSVDKETLYAMAHKEASQSVRR
ncbi:multidrug resistance-associated ABC transporter [Mycena sanguinolenta]|nr:multidrug resistance-associated ABC transporter [Mycena sanguinolenta]